MGARSLVARRALLLALVVASFVASSSVTYNVHYEPGSKRQVGTPEPSRSHAARGSREDK